MKMPEKIKEEYLAYCGVNCLLCTAYHHKKNPCPGCRTEESSITGKSCRNCSKKKCTRAKEFIGVLNAKSSAGGLKI